MNMADLIFPILIGITMVAVATVLLLGLISMGFQGSMSEKHSNLLMRWRVICQCAAVALIIMSFIFGL